MSRYNDPSYPPHGDWDQRLSDIACPGLSPIETIHENPWFSVRNRGGYYTLEYHLRHVAVLPVVNESAIVMVRVKRPVINDITLELPAGGVEKGEDPACAASRELAEEAGIVISDLRRYVPMPPIAVSSTRMPSLAYIFRVDVSNQEFAERRAHDDEIHSVERVAVRDLPGMMASGQIYVSVPLAVLGVFLSSRRGGISQPAPPVR
jgi:8-oxo-dGTP pyrophosphatase MutT (NUDIX family)